MKKWVKITLVVVLAAYAAFATVLLIMTAWITARYQAGLDEENAELTQKYEELLSDYNALNRLYDETVSVPDVSETLVLDAWASCVSDKSFVCGTDDGTALVVIYADGRTKDEMLGDLSEYTSMFRTALSTDGFEHGVIIAMSDEGEVVFGYAVLPDGEISPFVGENWIS